MGAGRGIHDIIEVDDSTWCWLMGYRTVTVIIAHGIFWAKNWLFINLFGNLRAAHVTADVLSPWLLIQPAQRTIYYIYIMTLQYFSFSISRILIQSAVGRCYFLSMKIK